MWKKIDAEWSKLEGLPTGAVWKRRTALIGRRRELSRHRDSDYMTGQAVNVDGGLVMGS
jgi:meso-butanediol dehydrogenase / (S,S)-butanediol dehydrogenase / diacetyl reductase